MNSICANYINCRYCEQCDGSLKKCVYHGAELNVDNYWTWEEYFEAMNNEEYIDIYEQLFS